MFTIVGSTAEHNFLIFRDNFEDFNVENWLMQSTDPADEGTWSIVLHEGNNVLSLQGNMDA
jgi:hypothetical protein